MGGKKNIQIKSYTTACDWLLATAPLLHLLDAWSNKDHFALGRADLALVVSGGTIDLSGHIPQTAIAVETFTIPSSGPYQITVSHAATFVTALGNPPVKYKGAQALAFSGPNPPGLGEYQVSDGVFTFNAGDAGRQVVISYAYATGAVDDANFFAVLGVSVEVDVSEIFTDFGDPAVARTTSGVQRRWLWNSFWDPPEVFEPAYGVTSRAPWAYSASGLVITVDPSLNGKTANVRVAFRIPTSSWDGNPLSAIPFGMQFEPQLGSGSEYVNHPDEQVVYPDCSGVASDRLDLGTGASYPQMSFEATGYYSQTADGDLNPADILLGMALLGIYNNPAYSGNTTFTTLQMLALSLLALGLDGSDDPIIAPPDDLRAFCEAYGIYISAPMDAQRTASDWFNEVCEIANAAIVASGFQVKIIPYCERSEIGNGVVYTAPTAAGPIYDFTDRDFKDKKQPVIIRIKRSVDLYNLQPVAYIDRSNAYADAQTTGADQGGVYARMTQRAQPKNYKTIFTADVADKVASVLVKKQSLQPNEYVFKVSSLRHVFVEAMDLVTLTEARTGLSRYPVRIKEANESDKKILECVAEDFFYGLNAPQAIASQSQLGRSVESNRSPGSVNPPIIFLDVPELNGGQPGMFLTLGISGLSPDWGGALVWVSLDGTTYSNLATQVGRSIMGVTTEDFPTGTDPDTTDDLPVDLSQSLGTLDSFSQAYEDQLVSLCYLGGVQAPPPPPPPPTGPSSGAKLMVFNPPKTGADSILKTYIYPNADGAAMILPWSGDTNPGAGGWETSAGGASNGYDFTHFDALINQQIANGAKSVAVILAAISFGGHNTFTPDYVFSAAWAASLPGSPPQLFTCAGDNYPGSGAIAPGHSAQGVDNTAFPAAWTAPFKTAWGNAVKAALNHMKTQPYASKIAYVRVGGGAGGEWWPFATQPSSPGLLTVPGGPTTIAALQTEWVGYYSDMQTDALSTASGFDLAFSINGGQQAWAIPYSFADAEAAVSAANGIGMGDQGLQNADIALFATHGTVDGGAATSGFPGANHAYLYDHYASSAIREFQTVAASDPTRGSSIPPAGTMGSLVPLLPYALARGANKFELYYEDWLVAYYPGAALFAAYGGAYSSAFAAARGSVTSGGGGDGGGGTDCIPYELIAYGLAELTAVNQYTLKATGAGNKIRRGIYSTPIGEHLVGSKFLFLGGPKTRLMVDPKWLGQTIHFKFTSVNTFGNQLESLADVVDYPYTIPVPCLGSILGGTPDAVIDIPATSAPGNFSIAHGLPATPKLALVQMTSAGKIWFQAVRYDAANINLVASDAGLTGKVLVYSVSPGAEVALTSPSSENFSEPHGLAAAPAVLLIQMTSGGEIWAQNPDTDAANVYLEASEPGLTGYAILWSPSSKLTAGVHTSLKAAPVFAGNFAIPHGLGVVPKAAFILMGPAGAGEIWFQPARYDATNIYLVASDGGLTALIEVFA